MATAYPRLANMDFEIESEEGSDGGSSELDGIDLEEDAYVTRRRCAPRSVSIDVSASSILIV